MVLNISDMVECRTGMEEGPLGPFTRLPVLGLRGLAMCACASLLSGCYKYVPTTLESVSPGNAVRTMLSADERLELRSELGLEVTELKGQLVEKSGDRVLLSVRLAAGKYGLGSQPLHQRIELTPAGIMRIDVRQTDPLRTAGLVGAFAGTAALGIAQLFVDREPGSPDGDTPPPDEHFWGGLLRVTVFRW